MQSQQVWGGARLPKNGAENQCSYKVKDESRLQGGRLCAWVMRYPGEYQSNFGSGKLQVCVVV